MYIIISSSNKNDSLLIHYEILLFEIVNTCIHFITEQGKKFITIHFLFWLFTPSQSQKLKGKEKKGTLIALLPEFCQ